MDRHPPAFTKEGSTECVMNGPLSASEGLFHKELEALRMQTCTVGQVIG